MERYKKYSSSTSDGDEISDETSTTRLFAYDLAEVKAMCVDGKTKSDVIRELVRRALYSRRYRQASTDPAFKEILKAFDDQVGVRLHHLEERLAGRLEADQVMAQTVLGYLYFAAFFGVEEMKQIRFLVTPEEVGEEEFLAAWEKRYQAVRERAYGNMREKAEARRKRVEAARGADHDGRGGDGGR
jgi:Arc/MetJ-type ribon-helix-helix transcriptional regulator